MQISYLDGPRLRRSLIAACDYAQHMRAELNRINVFPVPDGDTGTNLALTAQAIADSLRLNLDRDVSAVAQEAAQAAVLGARGNCGMMLSHFLLGFAEQVQGRDRLSTQDMGNAARQ
jgi:dihydroxyacetone kinase-like predicted kinase